MKNYEYTEDMKKGLEAQAENVAAGLLPLEGENFEYAEVIRLRLQEEFQDFWTSTRIRLRKSEKRGYYNKAERYKQILSVLDSVKEDFLNNHDPAWYLRLGSDYQNKIQQAVEDIIDSRKNPKVIYTPEGESKGVVKIVLQASGISMEFPKDDEFRRLVKSWGSSWDPQNTVWVLPCTLHYASTVDEAADIANEFIKHGYSVMLNDPAANQIFKSGSWLPKRTKIIGAPVKYPKKVNVTGATGEAREALLKMNGAMELQWSSIVSVPAYQAKALREFAEIYGFWISPGADKRFSEYEATQEARIAPKEFTKEQEGSLKDILNSSREVLDDLKD